MQKSLSIVVILLMAVTTWAQNPKLSYQAVVRDNQNRLITEKQVTVTVNILDTNNVSKFQQTLSSTTNRNGLLSLEIGEENNPNWSTINWPGAKIRTAIMLPDGAEVVDTTTINAVPMALYANNVSNAALANYLDSAATVRHIHDSLTAHGTGVGSIDCDYLKTNCLADYVTTNMLQELKDVIDAQKSVINDMQKEMNLQYVCGSKTMTDINNNTYPVVAIGDQCWMAQNLRTTTKTVNIGTNCWHVANSDTNDIKYGLLYKWAVADTICPKGWHLPSDSEWTVLTKYVHSKADYRCPDCTAEYEESAVPCIARSFASASGWNDAADSCMVGNAATGNNGTGFNAFPTGFYHNGEYSKFGDETYFWNSTLRGDNKAYGFTLRKNDDLVSRFAGDMGMGYSVRCLRNVNTKVESDSSAAVSCEQIMECMGDTLDKLNSKIASLTETVDAQSRQIDTLRKQVDSLSQPIPTPTPTLFTCGDSITDYQGHKYGTALFGSQCWMTQDLRVDNSTITPNGQTLSSTWSSTDTVSVYHHVDTGKYQGHLYNWRAAMDLTEVASIIIDDQHNHRGLCPDGWHLPTTSEWNTLSQNFSDYADNFKAILTGNITDELDRNGSTAYYWSTTSKDKNRAYNWRIYLKATNTISGNNVDTKKSGFSVRCLRD